MCDLSFKALREILRPNAGLRMTGVGLGEDYSLDGLLFVSDLLSLLLSDFDSPLELELFSPDFESDLLPDLA